MAELQDRITDYRTNDEINIVAAAGNRGGPVEAPARFPAAFAVGASDSQGRFCRFSARGDELDLVAPGCSLASADQHGQPAIFEGTSFAAPMVAAALAALRGYGNLTADEAENVILRSASTGPDAMRLNIGAALDSIGYVGSPPDFSEPSSRDRPAQPRDTRSPTYIEYSRPSGRAVRVGRSRKVLVRVRNRPKGVSVEVSFNRHLIMEAAHDYFSFRVAPRTRRVRIRFLGDSGTSPWRTLLIGKSKSADASSGFI
jgi:hypothetical protein